MATTITVSTLNGLYSALAKATGGETILLAGGDYGKLALTSQTAFDTTFASNVTIKSANPNDPAVFSGLDLNKAANLTLDGLTFDYDFAPGDKIYARPFEVFASDNITIRNSTFDGDVASGMSRVDNGYGFGVGLGVRYSSGVTLENNEMFNFHRGMVVSESDDIDIIGNDLHDMRSDGMNIVEVSGVRIEDNHIHDFHGSPSSSDHRDMIQFWTAGTDKPSTDIIIRGNLLDIGNGDWTQSIFMRNELVDGGLAGKSMYYSNVLIEENVIINAHSHGITLGETAGLTIRNNSVLHNDGGARDGVDAGVEIPTIRVNSASTGVTVTNNATGGLSGWNGQLGWVVKNNAFIQDQDPQAPGFYGDVFISTSLQAVNGVHDPRAVEGGMLDKLGAGATQTRDSTDAALTARFHVTADPDQAATRVFDASMSATDLAALPRGTVFQWNFGDGTTAKGTVVSHAFTDGGTYNVSLTIIQPGGTTSAIKMPVPVLGPELVSMTIGKGFTAYEAGAEINLGTLKMMTAEGLQLGAKGVAASVDRSHVRDILGADDFSIDLALKADVKGTSGEVFRLHGSFVSTINSSGEMSFRAFTTDGEIRLLTKGAALSNGLTHKISIDLADGHLQITVDGRLVGSKVMDGTLLSGGTHDLTFGNIWGQQNFNGDLKAFEITKDVADFHAVAQTTVISNPFMVLAPIAAKISMAKMAIDPAATGPDATHPVLAKMMPDQADHTPAAPHQTALHQTALHQTGLHQTGLPDLGDRFEFLAHHTPDYVMA